MLRVALTAALLVALSAPTGSASPPVPGANHDRVGGDAADVRIRSGPPQGFVEVPAGAFEMGSPESEEGRDDDEGPRRTVTFKRPLWVQVHEVTQAEWAAVMKTTPSYHVGCPTCPVERVSSFEAMAYANARSEAEGLTACYTLKGCEQGKQVVPAFFWADFDALGIGCAEGVNICYEGTWRCNEVAFVGVHCDGYRLPTEAEWEYFARAGTTTRYSSGDSEADLGRVGWYDGNSGDKTHPVGKKAANRWSLHDVHGNVSEWCQDWWGDTYPSHAETDPVGLPSGESRVNRGGSFQGYARWARSAYRDGWGPWLRDYRIGFRLVRAPRAP